MSSLDTNTDTSEEKRSRERYGRVLGRKELRRNEKTTKNKDEIQQITC